MKFWDASAVVPLILDEPVLPSGAVRMIFQADRVMEVWWGTTVECVSALHRMAREGRLTVDQIHLAEQRLGVVRDEASEIAPSDDLRQKSERNVRVHSLRAGDAFQLAAALTAAQEHPKGFGFVCLDRRLREAAAREGFTVLPE